MRPVHALVVAVGGATGSGARWGIVRAMEDSHEASNLPWELLIVNTAGSFVLGLVAFTAATGGREIVRLGLGVGFCGGLTTFSSFAVAAAELGRDEQTATAVIFVVASVMAAVTAVVAGAAVRESRAGEVGASP